MFPSRRSVPAFDRPMGPHVFSLFFIAGTDSGPHHRGRAMLRQDLWNSSSQVRHFFSTGRSLNSCPLTIRSTFKNDQYPRTCWHELSRQWYFLPLLFTSLMGLRGLPYSGVHPLSTLWHFDGLVIMAVLDPLKAIGVPCMPHGIRTRNLHVLRGALPFELPASHSPKGWSYILFPAFPPTGVALVRRREAGPLWRSSSPPRHRVL